MERVEELQQLYAFNAWANARVLDAAALLPEPDFVRDLGNSFPSIRDTLVHVMGAEWVWLQRWNGSSPRGLPDGWQQSGLAAIRERWALVEEERSALLRSLSPAELDRVVEYANTAGTPFRSAVWQMLRHVVNHSTYHRGQVTTMLRILGAAAPATDLILYYRMAVPGLPATEPRP